jgi:hypothetical protein
MCYCGGYMDSDAVGFNGSIRSQFRAFGVANIARHGADLQNKYRMAVIRRYCDLVARKEYAETSGSMKMPQAEPFLVLFAGIILATIAWGIVFGSPSLWIGHAFTGTGGLILLVLAIVTGAVRSGRLKSLHFRNVHFLHKTASVCFSGVVTGTFFLGLLVMIGHGDPILSTVHGVLGFTVAIVSVVQLVPSLAITRRERIQGIHKYLGYMIVPLFLFQVFLGVNAAELLESGSD